MGRSHRLSKLIGFDSKVGSVEKLSGGGWKLPTGEIVHGTTREAITYLKVRGAGKVTPRFERLKGRRS